VSAPARAFAVATPQADATAAAVRAFRAGGNAIDAALAGAAALAVTYPHNTGLGGDLFALVRHPGGRVDAVNASGPAARRVDADAQRRRGARMPRRGPDPITVPGAVAGWEALHALGAARPWEEALAAAIALAQDGVPVPRSLAAAIEEDARDVLADPGLRGVLAPGGRRLREGERLRQPALAATLRTLAAEGPRALYEGELAARLLAGLARAGSLLRGEDLAGFAPEVGPPWRTRFRGLDVAATPPNSAGALLLQALRALEASGAADPLGADAGLLAQLLRLGGEQRDARLADPRALPADPADWLGPERISALVAGARQSAGGAARPRGTDLLAGRGDTVAVVTADGSGRTVSLVQSLFASFGAAVLEPSTGMLLHDRGAAFSLDPGHPNELAPGRRPAHTLMPVLLERDGRGAGALGTMGGRAHAQILAQVLLALTDGADPQDAVAAPRWVVGGLGPGEPADAVQVEAGVPELTRGALAQAGLHARELPARSEAVGHAQAIWIDGDGTLRAGSDPRADGAAAAG
jgi:gamma-glutamyltranspeptidase